MDWRVVAGCRDCRLYSVASGETRDSAVLKKPVIELETQPVALAKTVGGLFVGTMDQAITCFTQRGKHWTVPSQAKPTSQSVSQSPGS